MERISKLVYLLSAAEMSAEQTSDTESGMASPAHTMGREPAFGTPL